jgi:hypothetical protein
MRRLLSVELHLFIILQDYVLPAQVLSFTPGKLGKFRLMSGLVRSTSFLHSSFFYNSNSIGKEITRTRIGDLDAIGSSVS